MTFNIFSENFDIDSQIGSVLFDSIATVCEDLSIPFFIVGAFARDIVMQHIYKISSTRKTKDVDIAVMVGNWNDYESIKKRLIHEYNFKQGDKTHELISNTGVYIDLIPFGEIEENHKIAWPPKFRFRMNMIGYEEVYQSAIPILLDGKYPLRVASLEGLVLLKLIAWNDRKRNAGSKHINDLMFIIDEYFLINIEEIVEKYRDLVDESDKEIDDTLIAAEALGRNISLLIKDSIELKMNLLSILEKALSNTDNSLLIQNMNNESRFDYPFCVKILTAFASGLKWVSPK